MTTLIHTLSTFSTAAILALGLFAGTAQAAEPDAIAIQSSDSSEADLVDHLRQVDEPGQVDRADHADHVDQVDQVDQVNLADHADQTNLADHVDQTNLADQTNLVMAAATLDGKININTASTAQLELLPGVGPSIAARIVSYRKQHPFKQRNHIMRVKGVGQKTFAKVKDYLDVEGDTTLSVAGK